MIALVPHPSELKSSSLSSVTTTVEVHKGPNAGDFTLHWTILDPHGSVSWPQHRSHKELWEETCAEFFLKFSPNESPYLEWNFAPYGDFNCFYFDQYRSRSQNEDTKQFNAPQIDVVHSGSKTDIRVLVSIQNYLGISKYLPAPKFSVHFPLVLVSQKGEVSYRTINHPKANPDFHHGDSFCYHL